MTRPRARAAVALLAILATAAPAGAARLRTYEATAAGLLAGRPDGIAISSTGELSAAPVPRRLSGKEDGAIAAQVWCMVTAPDGSLYLGTGPDGIVQRVRPSGTEETFARLPEPLVTALALAPDGSLLAGTSPNGLVFKIDAAGNAEPWVETEARYVWDLARSADGRVFAATGEPGAIARISAAGEPRTWFDAADAHVVRLRLLDDGGILAGTAGRGLVVRLDPEGRPIVLHDDDLPEIADVAVLPGGDVVAAAVAPPPGAAPRPAVRIRLPGDPRFGEGVAVDAIDEGEPVEVEGFIEGLGGPPAEKAPLRGRLVRIGPEGKVRELWRSSSEAPFALAVDAGGRTLMGTGEPARLYEIAGDVVSLLATLDPAQTTAIAPLAGSVALATSNPASSYFLERSHGEAGVFVSPVVDAGGPARWGTIRWWTDRFPSPVEMYTRTGSSAAPDDSWSAWSPAMTANEGSGIVNPDGRYLQWRVRIPGSSASSVRVADVRVTYEPYNRDPEIGEFRATSGTEAFGDAVSWAWKVRDRDGDALRVRVEARERPDAEWIEVARTDVAETPSDDPDRWRDGVARSDLSGLTEGPWEFRLRVDDAAANGPGEAGIAHSRERTTRFVDRTAPVGRVEGAGDGIWLVEAEDRGSGLREAIVLVDGEAVHRAEAEDGLCDGAAESFRIRLPSGATGSKLGLRLVDAAGNRTDLEIGP